MSLQIFEEIKTFVEFDDRTAATLASLGPVFEKHGQGITDHFYDTLGANAHTAPLLEGRVDALKATHGRWMHSLFAGEYGEDYYRSRERIGQVHVKQNIPPHFVEAVFNVIRTKGVEAINTELSGPAAVEASSALLKVLDLDLLIVNLAYGEERLDRLSGFTGFSRKLLENCIARGKK